MRLAGGALTRSAKARLARRIRPAPVHDAEGRGDGVHHLLPGAPAVIVKVHQPGALEGDAGLG